MIIKTTSKAMNTLWKIFLFCIVVFILLLFVLHKGVHFDKLILPNVHINGLYIKLDKKLFVEIDEIKISKTSKKDNHSSLDSFDNILNKIPTIQKFFNTILINSLIYKDQIVIAKYEDGYIFVDSEYLTLQSRLLSYKDGEISLDLKKLGLKDYNVILDGNFSGNVKENRYDFSGNYAVYKIKGEITSKFSNDILSYSVSSHEFDYESFEYFLDNLFSHVALDKEAQSWIYKRIKASKYKLSFFKGKINIETGDFYLNDLSGEAVAYDVNVKFHEDLPAANAQKAEIIFKNDKLVIFPINAIYEGLKLTNSNVSIENLTSGDVVVKVNLFTNELFEKRISDIVKAFAVEIPLRQTTGVNDAFVGINVRVEPFDVNVIGVFEVKNSNFTLSDVEFFSPHALISLNNTIINFNNSAIQKDQILNATINATLNATAQNMISNATINSLNITAKDKDIAIIKNKDIQFSMDIIDDGVKFSIDKYNATLTFANSSKFDLDSISKIYNFSPILKEFGIRSGKVSIHTNDFEKFNGYASIRNIPNVPLRYNNKTVTNFNGEFKIINDTLSIKSYDNKIKASIGEKLDIALQNIDFIFNTDKKSSNMSGHNESNKSNIKFQPEMPIRLFSENGGIFLEPLNITIDFNKYDINISKDGNISAEFFDNYGNLDFTLTDDNFEIYANDFTSSFINNLLQREFFAGGTFSSLVSGYSFDEFFGIISFRNSKLKDFKVANNIAAFINTIPSLATLSNPKYSTEGYPVKDGVIEFIKTDNYIYVTNLYFEGYSVDVIGYGYIDLDTKDIFLDLKITTLKSIGNLINKIPLVNFIILGEDGKITMSLLVKGKYDNPEVETNVVGGAITSPFNVIKRIFQLPVHFFQ